mmetsp:Transcript_116375/g.184082  ORF Transcript_116375/g.184082 Transcript_116375/m.184082 type:complete len:137 (-) Transcript_116375:95-505(-)
MNAPTSHSTLGKSPAPLLKMKSPLQRAYGHTTGAQEQQATDAIPPGSVGSKRTTDVPSHLGYPPHIADDLQMNATSGSTMKPVSVAQSHAEVVKDSDSVAGKVLQRRASHEERGRAFNVWKFRPTRVMDNSVRPQA